MVMEYSPGKTPKGRQCVLLLSSGTVTFDEADRFANLLLPGGEFYGMPLMATVKDGTDFTLDARKRFANMGNTNDDFPTAIVITSAPVRLMINFIVKASNLTRSKPSVVKFFSEKGEAMKWLDEEMDQRSTK
jgi:hypothetical protein